MLMRSSLTFYWNISETTCYSTKNKRQQQFVMFLKKKKNYSYQNLKQKQVFKAFFAYQNIFTLPS